MTGITETLRKDILTLCDEHEYTVDELTAKSKAKRSTVYYVVRKLLDEGELVCINPNNYKGRKYTAGNFIGRKHFIPNISHKTQSFKAIYYLNTTTEVVLEPYIELFGSIANIFQIAADLGSNSITHMDAELRLRKARIRILKARNDFQELSNVSKQILDMTTLWDILMLQQMPKDKDWHPELITYMKDQVAELQSFLTSKQAEASEQP